MTKRVEAKGQKQKQTKKSRFVPIAGKMKVVVTVGIAACVVVVLADLLATKYFTPDLVAKTKLEQIAVDYYENYYYDKIVEAIPEGETLDGMMAKFQETGFSPVYLRHLLLFDDGRNEASAKYFETQSYSCDKNETAVKFTPVAPFGRKNYTISYSLACNYK